MSYKDKKKQKAFQNEWVKNRRLEWIKENGPCARCGSDKDLEVDHIDPRIKVTHRVWSSAAAKRDKELKKCQVLCEKCHKEKTTIDRYIVKKRPGGTSKYKGVSWARHMNKWKASIGFKGKQIQIGFFDSEIKAAKAYDEKVKEIIGPMAYTNFK